MKVWVILLLCLVPAVILSQPQNSPAGPGVTAADTGQPSHQDSTIDNVLDDIVIEGDYEGEHPEDKIPFTLELDFTDVVQFDDGMTWYSADPLLEQQISQKNDAAIELGRPAPGFTGIRPQPVKSFQAEFEDLKRWELQITASDGSIFRTIAGEGNPPAEIAWDGLGDNDEPLQAGKNYAYDFIAVDKAGNRGSFPGQTFKVAAFYLQLGDTLVVGMDNSILYMKDGLNLRPEATDYIEEMAWLIRNYASTESITLYCGNREIETLVSGLAQDLVIDPSEIQIRRTALEDNSLAIYIQ